MVNDRVIEGRNLTQHPLADEGEVGVYIRGTPVACVRAGVGGRLQTAQGLKTFQPGDWICSSYPPSNAWVVRAEEFRVNNYTLVGVISDGDKLIFPSANTLEAMYATPPPESIPGVATGASLGMESEVTHPETTTADRDQGGTDQPGGAALPAKPANIPAPDPSPAAAVNQQPAAAPPPAKQTTRASQRGRP